MQKEFSILFFFIMTLRQTATDIITVLINLSWAPLVLPDVVK